MNAWTIFFIALALAVGFGAGYGVCAFRYWRAEGTRMCEHFANAIGRSAR